VSDRKRGGYVSAEAIADAQARAGRRERDEVGVSEDDLKIARDAARKRLRDSGGVVFERTGEVKQGTSPRRVRRPLSKTDYNRMNLPREHWKAHSRHIQDSEDRDVVMNYGKRVVEMVGSATGLILSGGTGTGKSSIAAVLAKEAVRWGFSAYFVSHEELAELRFEDPKFAEGMSVMGRVRSVDFLVLDNFDGRFLADKRFGPFELEKLVRRRNADLLTTVLTTRVGEGMAAKAAGSGDDVFPGLMSTLNARAVTMHIDGKDMRATSNKEARDRVFGIEED
jgi:hypothetical protein